ncbi:MAG: DUF433 domain-containing protein [Gammaproteobacteria bacterium]|nr:DUF433 domain-containing protein [Gammaproteobacteria bacterium]
MKSDISDVISSNPKIMGGTTVFKGTRVPVTHLIEYLQKGHDLDYFLDGFPTVSRSQAVRYIRALADKIQKTQEHAVTTSSRASAG